MSPLPAVQVIRARRVLAWGENASGQVGDGTQTYRATPVTLGLPWADLISAGPNHSHAVAAGALQSWGNNLNHTLGIWPGSALTPTPVPGLSGVVSISGGWGNSGAVKADGSVWIWGIQLYGALDGAATGSASTPVRVPGLPKCRAVSVGQYFTLVLTRTGRVYSWGVNGNGELGRGSTSQSEPTPKRLKLSRIVAVSAGSDHGLALDNSGRVYAWGANSVGELGTGGTVASPKPVRLAAFGNAPVRAIAAGESCSVALQSDGSVWQWGGLPGIPMAPAKVVGISQAVAIAAGDFAAGAIRDDRTLWCWGGLPGGGASPTPVKIAGVPRALAFKLGYGHALAIVEADAQFSPSELDFGDVQIGQSTTLPATFTNTGAVPLTIPSQPTIVGNLQYSGDFTYAGTFPGTLAPGGSVSVQVTFTPSAAAARDEALVVRTPELFNTVARLVGRGV